MKRKVTVDTKCWEDDWERLVVKGGITEILGPFLSPRFRRTLIINNVDDPKAVEVAANDLVQKGAIDNYIFALDLAKQALEFFGLSEVDFGDGYVYSIAELVAIHTCETPFLLHFAGDVLPDGNIDWVESGTSLLSRNRNVVAVNPLWNGYELGAARESIYEDEEFYYGNGFSDQCYLVETARFRAPIYQEQHLASERYPEYGGELFEKRVDAWMRNNGFLRATHKRASYRHMMRSRPSN